MKSHRTLATYAAAAAILVGGYFAGFGIHKAWFDGKPAFEIASGISVFAVLFVLALAIERIIQPFTPILGPNSAETKKRLEAAKAAPDDKASKQADIASATADLNSDRDMTAIVTWGAASALGFILSSALNVTMLGSVLASGQQPWHWVDLLITGLVIGAGTKPLNDLVTRLQDKDKAPQS